MKTLVKRLLFVTCLLAAVTQSEAGEMDISKRAVEMITHFERGALRPGYTLDGHRADSGKSTFPVMGMGPLMTIEPTESEEFAGVVELNGEDLAALGDGIFPFAFGLLDHKFAYMRTIGAAALNRLSKRNVRWFNFESPWESSGVQSDWALIAKKEWIDWYATKLASELNFRTKKAEQVMPLNRP
jgi:hypothetical protein